jgi:hypothetical protein
VLSVILETSTKTNHTSHSVPTLRFEVTMCPQLGSSTLVASSIAKECCPCRVSVCNMKRVPQLPSAPRCQCDSQF